MIYLLLLPIKHLRSHDNHVNKTCPSTTLICEQSNVSVLSLTVKRTFNLAKHFFCFVSLGLFTWNLWKWVVDYCFCLDACMVDPSKFNFIISQRLYIIQLLILYSSSLNLGLDVLEGKYQQPDATQHQQTQFWLHLLLVHITRLNPSTTSNKNLVPSLARCPNVESFC